MQTNGFFNRRQAEVLQTLFRGENKIRVENEISLPDYCSDVNRIIRTDVKIKQNEKKLSPHGGGLQLQIDGVVIFNCIYASDARGSEGGPESFTFYSDFSHFFKVPLDSADGFDIGNVAVFTEFAWENANGKLLGPRKLILRTDVVISAVLKANRSFIFYEKTDGTGDLQTKSSLLRTTSLVGTDEREFSVTEKIIIPSDSPAIGKILDCDAKFFCEKCTTSNGNVSFDGLISLSCLYVASGERMCAGILQPIEFTQTFELAEAKENSVIEIILNPTLLKVDFDMDQSGENRLLILELHYKASTYLYKNEILAATTDCFSLKNELALTTDKAGVEEIRAYTLISSNHEMRLPVNDENISDIQSIKGRMDFKDCKLVGDTVEVLGKLRLFMIGQREDGALFPMDESPDLEMVFSENSLNCHLDGCSRVELSGGLKSVECRLDSGFLIINAEIQSRIGLFARDDRVFIRDIETVKEKECSVDTAITFFYPNQDETLWEVAKLFNIPEKKLLERNALINDKLPKTIVIFK